MIFALLLVASLPCTFGATHSYSLLATLINGETQFPEFSVVFKVNDIPVKYYDGNMKGMVSRRFWRPDGDAEESGTVTEIIVRIYNRMKFASQLMMMRSNHTGGVHPVQGLVACDVDDTNLRRFFTFSAYDGEEYHQYDAFTETQITSVPELIWVNMRLEAEKMVFNNLYKILCVRALEGYLQEDRNFLLRKVHPRLRVFQKTQADSGETQVICLATGFYPRHINLSLLRDERPVPEEHLTGGELLPNGDGTYQMRKSLRVSEEELQGKHRYTCTVTHLSPNNTLHVSWEPESTPDTVIISIAVVSALTVTALITAAVLCWKRQTGAQKGCLPAPRVQYAAAKNG